jgi:16S rRNA (uracil1498-N3)-methyltransferase
MRHLFLPAEQIAGDTARILGADHLHLARVLRARPGESVILLDNAGNAYRATLVSVDKTETVARIEGQEATQPEPCVEITVAQALGKGDKFEQVLQHGTEVGTSAFLAVRAERSVVDIPAGRVAERVARWRQIAKGAAEQSGRTRIASVSVPLTSAEMLRHAADHAIPALLLHTTPDATPLHTALSRRERPQRLLIAVGPEGGWSPAEVLAARASNVEVVTLGTRVLRTETAALVAVSQILYHYESLVLTEEPIPGMER